MPARSTTRSTCLHRFGGRGGLSGGGRRAAATRRRAARSTRRRSPAIRGSRERRRPSSDRGATRWSAAPRKPRARGYRVVRIDDAGGRAKRDRRRCRTSSARWRRPAAVRARSASSRAARRPCTSPDAGEGGRNQEFALAAADAAGGRSARRRRWRASGTDGIDGPTDAAGAIVDSDHARAGARPPACRPSGFSPTTTPTRSFDALGDLIHTGPTGTNVGDLQVILLA